MLESALKAALVFLITSENSQIMKQGDADDFSLVDVNSCFAYHITHCKPRSCRMNGMVPHRGAMVMDLRQRNLKLFGIQNITSVFLDQNIIFTISLCFSSQ